MNWPTSVLAIATIKGLSMELGLVTPIGCTALCGHSVNGIGGVVAGMRGQG